MSFSLNSFNSASRSWIRSLNLYLTISRLLTSSRNTSCSLMMQFFLNYISNTYKAINYLVSSSTRAIKSFLTIFNAFFVSSNSVFSRMRFSTSRPIPIISCNWYQTCDGCFNKVLKLSLRKTENICSERNYKVWSEYWAEKFKKWWIVENLRTLGHHLFFFKSWSEKKREKLFLFFSYFYTLDHNKNKKSKLGKNNC